MKSLVIAWRLIGDCSVLDISRHACRQALEKGFHLVCFSLRDQLDRAVREVADISGDGEAGRHVLSCVAKADALHTARVNNMFADHWLMSPRIEIRGLHSVL